MNEKQKFMLQTLLVAVILNGLLLAALYVVAGEALQGQWLTILGIGLLITLVLWFIIQFLGNRLIGRATSTDTNYRVRTPPSHPEERPQPAPPVQRQAPPTPAAQTPTAEAGALQMLSIFQRQGRLIDFLQEDLALYEDAQIGAAVRSIHEGCKQALIDHIKLEPIFEEVEGAEVTVQPGFDPRQVRLTGNVMGNPPFKGALRHRGWRVTRIELPTQMHRPEREMILVAAEVEVEA
jgi:hypothetical protein